MSACFVVVIDLFDSLVSGIDENHQLGVSRIRRLGVRFEFEYGGQLRFGSRRHLQEITTCIPLGSRVAVSS